MKVEIETVDSVRRRLAVEVPAETVRGEIERTFDSLQRTAKVRGFRPGRVPRPVLDRLFGDQVRAEVFSKLIQESFADALRGQQLEPVGEPEVVTEQAEANAPLRYSVTIEVKPDVIATGYRGLEVDRPVRDVTEADVDAFLNNLRESLAQLRPIVDRSTAQGGDMATIDYEARIGDRVAGRGDGRVVEVEATASPTSLGAHLKDATVGLPIDFAIAYPAEYGNAELAGQTVAFHVVVKALATKELPPLDDEFAKDHGECDTLDALRQRVREQLQAVAARDADGALRASLVEQLVSAHPLAVPHSMVERRTGLLVEEFLDSLGPRRPPASREADLRARLHDELHPRAEQQVKASLLLEAIARQEQLMVSDDELDVQIDRFLERAGTARERMRALYQEPAARARLRAQLLQERALDRVVEHARVKTVPLTSSVADTVGNG
jgi:trigger factor